MTAIVEDMVRAMMSARDLCGNAGEAAREAALDYHGRKPTDDEMIEAIQEANRQWRESQKAGRDAQRYCAHHLESTGEGKMTHVQAIDYGVQAREDATVWVRNAPTVKPNDREVSVYSQGFAEGYRQAIRILTLHGALALEEDRK